ncbi:family A G protein-coupled receptor-like protein [Xylaria cf. heliscus]|nr:family A G protein-coupled receptor-like protein [Xylaria cf. heliscus]
MDLYLRGNDALNINPSTGVSEALSAVGSDWLWAVTGIYLVAFFAVLIPCFTSRESDRVFHYLYTLTVLVGAVTYYAEASNLGWSAVGSRQIFFARYVNWVVAFPSAALGLGMLSGVSWTTIITNIICSWVWVLTYIAAAYTTTVYKWGFYAFGTFTYLILAMSTLNESREAAQRIGIARDYIILSGWVNLIWLLYPIAFALTDGAGILSVTNGSIFVGILDILMMPLWSIGFILMSRNWDYKKLHLNFSEHRFDPNGNGFDGSSKGDVAPITDGPRPSD